MSAGIADQKAPFAVGPSGNIPSLDGFRAISIAIVFLGHVTQSPLIPGGLGVTIFFFISGYLITTLLLREYSGSGRIDFRAFYQRRVLRLAPPLAITLLLGIICVLAGLADGDLNPVGLLSQVFFFYNYWDSQHTGNVISGMGILWSLSVEEHFYLLFPVVLWVSLRYRWPSWWLPVLALAVLAWRTIRYVYLQTDEWQIYAFTDTRIDSLLWGCWLAVLMAGQSESVAKYWLRLWWLWLGSGVVVMLASLAVRDPLFRSTLRYTLQGVALLPIFYFAVVRHESPVFRPLNWWWVRRIGVYSYTIYLVHYLVLNMLKKVGFTQSTLVIALLTGTIAIAYAALVFEFAEKPVKRLRKRLGVRPRPMIQAT